MLSAACLAQVRVANWNISNYAGTNRAADIQNAVYGTFEGRQFAPDILACQEFLSAGALNTFVNVLNTASGSPGDWAAAPFIDGPDTESVLVYRTSRFDLIATTTIALGSSATTNQPRNTYRYDLRPDGYTSAAATVAVYSSHMKAQESGSEDDLRRLVEAQRIRDNAEGVNTNGPGSGMPAGYNFVFCGDTNIQASSSTEYQEFVASQANNAGRFFDPINSPGTWNNNGAFDILHTQDPAGGGGMDDRHDQILISGSLRDIIGWHYIGSSSLAYSTTTWNDPNHSYRVWGNDGTSFNLPLKVVGNTMVGPSIAQDLIDASAGQGHLPLYADFRVPAKIGANTLTLDFGTVPVGSTPPALNLTISNAGDTALFGSAGIATLNYSLAAVADFTVPAGSFSDAAGGAGNDHAISMSTATAGPKSQTLIIPSDDPDSPSLSITLTGQVSATNQSPVADAGADINVTDADLTYDEEVTLDGSLSADPDGSITNYEWSEDVTVLASGPSPTAGVTLPVGVHEVTLTVTDNGAAIDTDTVTVTIDPRGCGTIDFNRDEIFPDIVDLEDFLSVFAGGSCSTGNCDSIDYNGDGIFPDIVDLESFLLVFGGGTC